MLSLIFALLAQGGTYEDPKSDLNCIDVIKPCRRQTHNVQTELTQFEKCELAVCRVSAPGDKPGEENRGSGCAFYRENGNVYVLTNWHMAKRGMNVSVEFWRDGYKSDRLPAYCEWSHQQNGIDMAVLRVSESVFGGLVPPTIPICGPEFKMETGDTIRTIGCPEGGWLKAISGRLVAQGDIRCEFVPPCAHGQSGSPLFDKGFNCIIGLIAWNNEQWHNNRLVAPATKGIAMNCNALWQHLQTPTSAEVASDAPMDQMIQTCFGKGRGLFGGIFKGKCGPGGCDPQGGGDFSDGECPPEGCPPQRPSQPDRPRGGDKNPWRKPSTPPIAPIPGDNKPVPPPSVDYQKQIDELKSAIALISREPGKPGRDGVDGKPGPQGQQGFAGPPGKDANVEEWAAKLKALDDRLSVKIGALESHPRDDARVNELLAIVKAQNEKLAALEKLVNSLSGGATIVVNP